MNEFSYSIEYLSQGCWVQLLSCFEFACQDVSFMVLEVVFLSDIFSLFS